MKNSYIISLVLMLLFPLVKSDAQELVYRDGYYYKNELLYTGTHITYYEDGGGGMQMEMSVRNGLLNGLTRVLYPSGMQKEQRYYSDGEMDSLWINWSEKGVILGEARYKKGVKDGFWHIWDENGVKRYEMFYREGQKAGTWFMWDENGKLISEKKYD